MPKAHVFLFKDFQFNLFVSHVHCIEVAFSDEKLDSVGLSTAASVHEDLGIQGITKIRYSEAYCLDLSPAMTEKQAKAIAEKVILDPISQKYSLNKNLFPDFDFLIEVKFHPDVTDNLAIVTQEAIEDFLGKKVEGKIVTSRKYYIYGSIGKQEAEKIAGGLLANGIIETYKIEAGK
ncbi:Phosphoribosylformylglycinamidine synthase subunit PurS [uncultured archaeon]|nr:Phosphoribosylformylglycinamidine synthase subunit PurS [uncultured archaeon]